jgi:hypothetical protein
MGAGAVTDKLTKAQRRALEIVRDKGPVIPGQFAHFMWPDSSAWGYQYNSGHGAAAVGRGIVRSGGAYLGKLYHRGWVRRLYDRDMEMYRGYVLTEEGERVLVESEV